MSVPVIPLLLVCELVSSESLTDLALVDVTTAAAGDAAAVDADDTTFELGSRVARLFSCCCNWCLAMVAEMLERAADLR